MPTILRIGPYRFFFYSNESREPAHIHVTAEGSEAKFWLATCELASSYGFRAHELTELIGIVIDNKHMFTEAWDEYFAS